MGKLVRLFGGALLIMSGIAAFAAEAGSSWVRVSSPHFDVISNAPAAQARDVARRFERVRAVFVKAFPGMTVYPDLPILIFAARDRASFEALSPPSWAHEIPRSGMLLRNPDKNFILLLLDAPGEDPYHVIYHEYAHLVLEDDFPGIPLWVNEGLAQFYGNSEIDGRTVRLGLPSQQNIDLLRQRNWLPLTTLFTIDQRSPYYNEQDKGTIFYAESWALTDYLMFAQGAHGPGPIDRYLDLIAKTPEIDPVVAAGEAFGDLNQLQDNVREYVRRSAFRYYRLKMPNIPLESTYQAEPLSLAQSEMLRGDFMTRTGQLDAASAMLTDALRRDPHLTAAEQSLGLIEAREGHTPAAIQWFAKAAAHCQECVYARFYNALALMQRDQAHPSAADRAVIRSGFEDFTRFNPTFAPAFEELARFDATTGGSLATARQVAAQACKLDPQNVRYLFLESEIAQKMGDTPGALRLARRAVNLAASPQDKSRALVLLGALQEDLERSASQRIQ